LNFLLSCRHPFNQQLCVACHVGWQGDTAECSHGLVWCGRHDQYSNWRGMMLLLCFSCGLLTFLLFRSRCLSFQTPSRSVCATSSLVCASHTTDTCLWSWFLRIHRDGSSSCSISFVNLTVLSISSLGLSVCWCRLTTAASLPSRTTSCCCAYVKTC